MFSTQKSYPEIKQLKVTERLLLPVWDKVALQLRITNIFRKGCKDSGGTANTNVASVLAMTHAMNAVTHKSLHQWQSCKRILMHKGLVFVCLQKWRYLGGSPRWGAVGWASAPLCWRLQRLSGHKYSSSKSWMMKKKKRKHISCYK